MRGIKSIHCGICGKAKKSYPSGRTRCLACERERAQEWRQDNPEEARKISREWQAKRRAKNPQRNRDEQWAWRLQREYGITVLQYHDLFEKQGGGCAICQSPDPRHASGRMVVDHDHNGGGIRGLLCGWCNSALGYLKDDPELAHRAIEYLKKGGVLVNPG